MIDNKLIRFQAENGTRLHRYFYGVTDAFRDGEKLWWSDKLGVWINLEESSGTQGFISNYATGIKTLKAFLSHVRRHNLDSSRLCSRFIGYDVYYNAEGFVDD